MQSIKQMLFQKCIYIKSIAMRSSTCRLQLKNQVFLPPICAQKRRPKKNKSKIGYHTFSPKTAKGKT